MYQAKEILAAITTSCHHQILTREEQSEGFREVRRLCTESIALDATVSHGIINRALAHLKLNMYQEAVDDATWAEQVIRDGPQPLDDSSTISLANAIYYGAYLHASQDLVAGDQRVKKHLDILHGVLDDLKERFGDNLRAQQLQRIKDWDGYGYSVYELALLDEAGLPPWYGFVKDILKVVNGPEMEGPSKKSRAYYEASQCNNCWVAQSEVKLFLCGKCKAAKYCSKECQKVAWKDHKTHCKVAAANRQLLESSTEKVQPFANAAADLPESKSELHSLLQTWTNRHRPSLAAALVDALNLRSDPKAHISKSLFVMVDWVSGEKGKSQRFRVVSAVLQDLLAVPRLDGEGIAKTRENLDAAHRKRGGYGVAMMVIMCCFYATVWTRILST
ncbi:hypothetical protein AURDEDRAFT_128526 [Auricularia subglabra TFB-10046 SS5]|uniref:MYND-type domain-containing protein n=1 Tax=Auricularia subglabra (strain TFB-10046 / SS5) TaxID=717982 RepID=J0WX57_AURST|nr:hypothetical protein AURDEDRAFT_128526 [Auricularia subglabra TFB-10046 SS5]